MGVGSVNAQINDLYSRSVPSGTIVMWWASFASIPAGWRLCDGGGGTPDLRNRFPVGAGLSYGLGATGGQDNVALSIGNLPPHGHRFRSTGNRGPGGSGREPYGFTEIAGGAVHTTETVGSGFAHENRPPFIALGFIMKL